MKTPVRFVHVVTVAFGIASSAHAQQPKATATQTPDARAVLELEDAWARAVVKRDAATFKRLLAPGFIYTEDARTYTADELVRDIVSGKDTITDARNEELQTRTFDNTMVVTGWLIMRGRSEGKPFERRYRFTDVWVKRANGWQIVAAQDYLAPAGSR